VQTIQVQGKTGSDGVLHLSIPLGPSEAEFEVLVVVQPKAAPRQPTPEELGWPPGFFEQTAGAWQGNFERAPQSEFEKR
jgi:hypothetical protein